MFVCVLCFCLWHDLKFCGRRSVFFFHSEKALFLGFAFCHGDLPDKFWRERTDAWLIVRKNLRLNATTLASLETLDLVEADDVDPAWTKQNW